MIKILLYTISILLFSSNIWFSQVEVSIPDTTAEEGIEIKIPIFVSDLTDLKVRSYYFEFKYDNSLLRARSISNDGTISDVRGWDVDGGFTNEGIYIRGSGYRNLKGSGKLISINFEVIDEEGYTDLEITKFIFNSGFPEANMSNGSFRVYAEKKISFNKTGNGDGRISINGEKFNLPLEKKLIQGVSYSIQAYPEDNSSFNSWSGDINFTENPITYLVENTEEIIVDFSLKTHSISATIEPEGFGQVDGVGVYLYGDEVTLIAKPYAGKNFVNWTINGNEVSKELSYTFNVNNNIEVVANFETGLFQVSTNTNPVEAGQTTGAGFYFPHQNAEITATSNEGWKFINWTSENETISEDSVFSFTVADNITLTANYGLLTDIDTELGIKNTFINSPYPNLKVVVGLNGFGYGEFMNVFFIPSSVSMSVNNP